MPIDIVETNIPDLAIIIPHQYDDGTFYLTKYFQKDVFDDAGLPIDFSEANIVAYKKGTLRGLHYQEKPSQGKLICVVRGSVFVTALDLRENSKTFGRYECFTLFSKLNKAIYIPELFAIGILALKDAVVSYNCTGKYIPENCGGITWSDAELNIPWPLDKLGGPVRITEKDGILQTFGEYRIKLK
jgi:dTDP-4-dehydrorhamnose 3,5-epimerase